MFDPIDARQKASKNSQAKYVSTAQRIALQYKRTVDQINFCDSSRKLTYTPSLLPGIFFYNFLAVPTRLDEDMPLSQSDAEHHKQGQRRGRGHRKLKERPLEMWIPDTILYSETMEPSWIYTDANGYVRRTNDFTDSQVEEKLGCPEMENEIVVICKEPSLSVSRADIDCVQTSGSKAHLLSSKELRTFLTKSSSARKHSAVQKFIKCKGASAFILRAVYRMGRPHYAWSINNTTGYDSSDEDPSLNNRYCTATSKINGCTFIKLPERACVEVSELNTRLLKYAETALRCTLELFVADFVKDDYGQYWFIQVKCFRLRGVSPEKPIGLSIALQKLYHRAVVDHQESGEANSDDEEGLEESALSENNKRVIYNSKRHYPCKCCAMLYPPLELPYKMTLKMIYETAARIKSRLPPSSSLSFFGAISTQKRDPRDKNGSTNRGYSTNSALHKDSSLLYQPWRVCTLCYTLYEEEKKLANVELNFSRALGCPKDRGELCSSKLGPEKARSIVDPQMEIPVEFTLCRIMVFFHTLYDIPKRLYEIDRLERLSYESQRKPAKLYIRFEVLGYVSIIPLDNYAMIETQTPIESTDEARTFHFFAPNTPLSGKVHDNSGLGTFLNDQPFISVDLVRCSDVRVLNSEHFQMEKKSRLSCSTLDTTDESFAFKRKTTRMLDQPLHKFIYIGSSKIQLNQFRSSYVSKTDVYSSMGTNAEFFNLKGHIAMERIRLVDSRSVLALNKLRVCHGVYVPDVHYRTNDRISAEWLESLPESKAEKSIRAVIGVKLYVQQRRRKILQTGLARARSKSVAKKTEDKSNNETLEDLIDEQNEAEKKRLIQERKQQILQKIKKAKTETKLNSEPSHFQQTEEDFRKSMLVRGSISSRDLYKGEVATWSVTILLHRTHHLHLAPEGISRENRRVTWEIHYNLFGQESIVVETPSAIDDLEFNSTRKHYVQCERNKLCRYFDKHTSIPLRIVPQDQRHNPAIGYTSSIDLSHINLYQNVDGTFDILDSTGSRLELGDALYPPYISASVYVSKMAVIDATNRADYRIIRYTDEEIGVLQQV